ncbi:MAG TPA: UDP-N-acetylmuramoyl-L-alanyl-D-glutamate--2,6-diaminopimelate ligase [Bdellovibrionales bacterium]|nr:UDP-N-acetylmuramoyl-L-alanyl-D-glutamate--2,6-diaminopimelate ligase [Bdellovibrionales bacterium]
MNVREFLQVLPGVQLRAGGERKVSALCFDSRTLSGDCVFVAVRGGKVDGHQFLVEAASKGAAALIVEDPANVPADYPGAVAVVPNTRVALNKLAARFYGNPADKLFCVGVTGTNGKTTTTYMVEAIFSQGRRPAGVIGTIDHHFKQEVWKTDMTTPDPVSFQSRLRNFVDLGAKSVALEVSSHALRQSRVDEVPFDVAVFTNLSRDHLDYHTDMEDYFDAKNKLFRDLLSNSKKPKPTAVINADDEYGRRIQVGSNVRLWYYGPNSGSHIRYTIQTSGFSGSRFQLATPVGNRDFSIRMVGLHNVANACAAIGAGLAADLSMDAIAQALGTLNGVSGRLEAVPNKRGVHIFVDYAHTDDAIQTVLHHLDQIRKGTRLKNKIITVFGCGGDRDSGKRPLMMKAALKYSDYVVLTSDNPRTEDPEKILDDAMAGAPAGSLDKTIFRNADRKQGIAKAIELANEDDVILIAGKGHEDYQQIGTTKYPFSDIQVVKELLK